MVFTLSCLNSKISKSIVSSRVSLSLSQRCRSEKHLPILLLMEPLVYKNIHFRDERASLWFYIFLIVVGTQSHGSICHVYPIKLDNCPLRLWKRYGKESGHNWILKKILSYTKGHTWRGLSSDWSLTHTSCKHRASSFSPLSPLMCDEIWSISEALPRKD